MGGKLGAAFCRDEGGRDIGFDPLSKQPDPQLLCPNASTSHKTQTKCCVTKEATPKDSTPLRLNINITGLKNSFNKEANVETDLILIRGLKAKQLLGSTALNEHAAK